MHCAISTEVCSKPHFQKLCLCVTLRSYAWYRHTRGWRYRPKTKMVRKRFLFNLVLLAGGCITLRSAYFVTSSHKHLDIVGAQHRKTAMYHAHSQQTAPTQAMSDDEIRSRQAWISVRTEGRLRQSTRTYYSHQTQLVPLGSGRVEHLLNMYHSV